MSCGDQQKGPLGEGGEDLEWAVGEGDGERPLRVPARVAGVGRSSGSCGSHSLPFIWLGLAPAGAFPKHGEPPYKSRAPEWHGRWTVVDAAGWHPDPRYANRLQLL